MRKLRARSGPQHRKPVPSAAFATTPWPNTSVRDALLPSTSPREPEALLSDIPSCSVACSKAHRENHPPEEERKPPVPVAPDAPLPDKKSTHPFSVLDDSKELQRLFARYPMLKAKLERIHDTTLPGEEDDVQKGGLPRKPQPSQTHGRKPAVWTPEVGLRRAQQALRRARTDPGEDGDGVREYCELVVHLLSRAGRTDATEMVRHEVVQEEVKAIEWLMNTEK